MKRGLDPLSLESASKPQKRSPSDTRLRCLLIALLAIALTAILLFTLQKHGVNLLSESGQNETSPATTSSSPHSTVSNRTNQVVSTTAQNTKTTSKSSSTSKPNVDPSLLSNETLQDLKRTLASIDDKVDPCEDFYDYACGNWLKAAEPGLQSSSLRPVFESSESALEKAFLKYYETKETKPQPVSQMYEFFEDCVAVETNRTKRDFLAEVKKSIEKVGGIPALLGQKWNEVALPTVMDELLRWDFLPFFKFAAGDAPDRYNFKFAVSGSGANSTSTAIRKESYKQMLREMMAPDNQLTRQELRQQEKELEELFDFIDEFQSRAIPSPRSAASLSVGELESNLTMFNFTNIVRWSYPSMKYSRIQNDTLLNLKIKGDDFERIVSLFNSTKLRVLVNYAIFEFYASMRKNTDEMNSINTSNCAELAIYYNGFAMTFVYYKFHKIETKAAVAMMDNIVAAFRSNLEKYEWLDDETRKNAIEKLDNLEYFIGAPEPEKDMEEIYSMIPSLDGMGFHQKYWLLKLLNDKARRYKFERKNGRIRPTTQSNAYYLRTMNTFFINDGVLFPHAFHSNFSSLLNYARLGYIIGHEMIHGFDNGGSRYFKDGKKFDWFTAKARTAYGKRMQCLIELYESIFVNPTFLRENGTKTINENIADQGGFKQALAAYNKFARANDALSLGYNGYSADQLFFIANAQMWCGKRISDKNSLKKDTHSLPKFRTNMNVMNHEEFANAFECPIGSKMNAPKSKECHVW